MTATSNESEHPLHRRRDVWLLVAPVVAYLFIFSLFPLLYSLVETAKANGLEPYAYLSYLFEHLPARPRPRTPSLRCCPTS